jgi:hypothetical protein
LRATDFQWAGMLKMESACPMQMLLNANLFSTNDTSSTKKQNRPEVKSNSDKKNLKN